MSDLKQKEKKYNKIMKNKECENIDIINAKILRNNTETVAGQLFLLKEMYKSGDLTKK